MRDKLFDLLARVSTKYPKRILLFALILFVISAGLSGLAVPKLSWIDLLPQDEPRVVEFEKILKEFGTTDVMLATIEGPDPKELIAFATTFEKKLFNLKNSKKEPMVKRVTWHEDVTFMLDHGFMLIKAKDLQRMLDSGIWDEPGIARILAAQNDDFKREYVDAEQESLEKKESDATRAVDTMWQLPQSLRWYLEHTDLPEEQIKAHLKLQAQRYIIGDERYLSDDKSILLIQIQPTVHTEDAQGTIETVEAIKALFEEQLTKYPLIAKNYPGPWPGKTMWDTPEVNITPKDKLNSGTGLSGWHKYYYDETMTMFHDFGLGMISAFVLVLLLFVIAFRMWTSPILAMIVLVMSIVMATGVIGVVLGELNMMSMMFPIILLGLGVDYAVHLVGEFTKRRHDGETIDQAIYNTLHSTGKGILTGGLTTAISFLALGLTSFKGLVHLGVGSGVGVLSTLVTSFLVLPAALVVIHRWQEKRRSKKQEQAGKAASQTDSQEFFLEFAFLRKTGTWAYKFWPVTILVVIIVSVFMLSNAKELRWEKDMLKIEAKNLASLSLNKVLEKRFYIHPDTGMVSATSLEQAYDLTQKLEDLSTVRMVESISFMLPPQSKQAVRQPIVKQIQQKVKDWPEPSAFNQTMVDDFVQQLLQMDCNIITMKKSAYMSGMDRLYNKTKLIVPEGKSCVKREPGQPRPAGGWPKVAASQDVIFIINWLKTHPQQATVMLSKFQEYFEKPMRAIMIQAANPEPVTMSMLPEETKQRYISKQGDKFLLTIYPKGNVWDEDFQNTFIPQLESVDKRVTGTPLLFNATVERGGAEGRKATYLCLFAIIVLLIIDFWGLRRKIKSFAQGLLGAVLAMIPLFVSALWMMGVMNMLGIRLNMINIIAIPLILGIGIDDGVHIIHRYRHEGKQSIGRVLSTTGRSVLLTSLTTVAAFGSFALGMYQGFVGMGIILAVGIAFCFLLSVYLLPALIKATEKMGLSL